MAAPSFQILIHPFATPDFFCPKGFFKSGLAFGKVVTIQNRVMEVIKDCPTIDEFAGSAQMVEPRANIRVLAQAPSFVLLVPTIDGEEVASPHGHVATDDSALGGVSTNQRDRKTKAFGGTRQLAGEEKTKAGND